MIARPFGAGILALVLFAAPVAAQTGTITGKVTDSVSAAALAGATVQARSGATAAGSVIAADDGTYRIGSLQAGVYSVIVTRIGYQPRRVEGVRVESGGTATVNLAMAEVAAKLNSVVTTASRAPEKILDAPASISVVETREIAERPSISAADHLKSVPGLAVSTGGIAQSNISARGFNNAFSGSMLVLQDYRFAGVPSLRVNVPFLFTGTNEDIERIEVLLGPASALYGPNSSAGVLNIITKSPFDSKGTTLTLDGGERSILRGSVRHSAVFNEQAALKLSGEYFTGDDFKYFDPGEGATYPPQAPPGRRGTPITRDFSVNRYAGEARLDLRPTKSSELISTYGISHIGNGLELTGANGAAQAHNWTYQTFQERFRWNRFFIQAFMNSSNAGNEDSLDTRGTFLLRSGQPIVDKSRVFAGSAQHAYDFGPKQSFVYGLDYIKTNPRSGGTINGRNENRDDVQEIGGYVQSTSRITPMFDFLAALRVDQNDQIDGTQFSPRAALIFKPSPNQNFRFTYNRAFSTPANFSYFLDLINARNLGGTGFDVRAIGNPPKVGWKYARSCDSNVFGGICMKSPYTGTGFVPASATAAYPALVTSQQALLTNSITAGFVAQGIPQQQAAALASGVVGLLKSLTPTPADISSRVRYITPGSPNLAPTDVSDIQALKAAYNQTYEVGYKGILGNRARLAIDGWYQRRGDVGTPAGLATPNVFFDSLSLRSYLIPRITAALTPSLGAANAAGAATAIATGFTSTGPGRQNLGNLPVGVVTFNGEFGTNKDIIATYQVVNKSIDVGGIDLALDYLLSEQLTLSASYDYINKSLFPEIRAADGSILALNAPDHRATVATKWRDERHGFSFEVRGRYANSFPVESGVYSSLRSFTNPTDPTKQYTYPNVPVNAILDLGFSWRLPFALAQQVTWSLNGTNILNNEVPTFDGTPAIGRLVMTRLQYQF
jgi:outer membrane receptor for ferrienterochelin and colicins